MILEILAYLFLQAIVTFFFIFIVSFIVWMAVDAGRQDKFWWLMLIVGIPFIGAIVYYFVEHQHDYAKMPIKVSKVSTNVQAKVAATKVQKTNVVSKKKPSIPKLVQ